MINEKGIFNHLPYPRSARVLLWYGWKDDPDNEYKKYIKSWYAKVTFQCMGMIHNTRRCHRKNSFR